MCGIAGLVSSRTIARNALSALGDRMGDAIAHRGPDASGTWTSSDVPLVLAHRRLSIIDLSANANQPMCSRSGRWTIAFNGEAYNFRELRGLVEAAAGHRMRTNSDTEVVLEAMACWGVEKTIDQINGMFAFAAFDTKERCLYLVRDRLGEKPLYYGMTDSGFVFASELRPILSLPNQSARIDGSAVQEYLRFGYVGAPRSILSGINKLLPGTYVRVDLKAGGIAVRDPECYWDVRKIARAGVDNPKPFRKDELDSLVSDAVNMRLVSDVPIGCLLSGGIDSSIVTAVAANAVDDPSRLATFTVGFEESNFDESLHADRIARKLGTWHHHLVVAAKDALEIVPRVPDLFDEPFADSSQIPTYLIAKKAREHVKVVLSGDGGDETFLGYTRYRRKMAQWRRSRRLPNWALHVCGSAMKAASKFSEWSPIKPLSRRSYDLARASSFFHSADLSEAYRLSVSRWLTPESLLARTDEKPAGGSNAYRPWFGDDVRTLALIDQQTYLPDDILCKVDRASMAVALEARVPLLDHRIVEYAWMLGAEDQFDERGGKRPLREVLDTKLERALTDRPKQGFGIPLDPWLRGSLRSWAEATFSKSAIEDVGIFDYQAIRNVWTWFISGQRNTSSIVWTALMLQAWANRYKVSA